MLVTNMIKEISEPLVVSKEFGIVLSNLSKDEASRFYAEIKKIENSSLKQVTKNFEKVRNKFSVNNDDDLIEFISKNVVVMAMDKALLSKERLFADSRLHGGVVITREDYCRKFFDFIMEFFIGKGNGLGLSTPDEIVSLLETPIYDFRVNEKHIVMLFCYDRDYDLAVKSVVDAGKKIDNFVSNNNDFRQLDFLIRVLSQKQEYTMFHVLNNYTILECVFGSHVDLKLEKFYSDLLESEGIVDRIDSGFFTSLKTMRNKIAHGAFKDIEKEIKKYAKGHSSFSDIKTFDEASRTKVFNSLCSGLDMMTRSIVQFLFHDKKKINEIRNLKYCEKTKKLLGCST